ncbi:large ribosomal subunit protein uL29x-like isoform X2 [Miscanthus floridulus]|uniref:large ribosomal subunit protein uL29x-like isoform X2 n=1 Tax=Miscanthus floridulus TaxID=154761 RepID=UPI00345AB377
MDPVKLDEIRKKRKAERMAQLKELKAELKKLKEERSLPGAKVTDGAPNKLSKIEKLRPFLAEVAKKQRAALREAYSNREPPILRLYSQEDPCCTTASPPAFSEDGEGKEA